MSEVDAKFDNGDKGIATMQSVNNIEESEHDARATSTSKWELWAFYLYYIVCRFVAINYCYISLSSSYRQWALKSKIT